MSVKFGPWNLIMNFRKSNSKTIRFLNTLGKCVKTIAQVDPSFLSEIVSMKLFELCHWSCSYEVTNDVDRVFERIVFCLVGFCLLFLFVFFFNYWSHQNINSFTETVIKVASKTKTVEYEAHVGFVVVEETQI